MFPDFRIAEFWSSLLRALAYSIVGSVSIGLLNVPSQLASAQGLGNIDPAQSVSWTAGAINQAQQMRSYQDPTASSQQTPSQIPEIEADGDPSGRIATYQPEGATVTANNAFFQNLGTNGRTCFTCHQPQNGWTISAAGATARFQASSGTDPLFRLVDGATCPTDNVSNLQQMQQAYQLLTGKGLIRIGIPLPSNRQFEVSKVDDPYNCTTNPATGLARNKKSGVLSMYRRPLPATNLGFLTAIMWDGREPSLAQQAIDATLIHAQADPNTPPTSAQQDQIVSFESGIFTAQILDNMAQNLNAYGGNGGPVALSLELANFFIGVNDPLGNNPTGKPFNPNIFDLYNSPSWSNSRANGSQQRNSIARGEVLFNTTQINITGVTGLNDVLGMPSISGFCGTCHDTPNVGDHSVKAPLNIGIANAGANSPPALDISELPVFTLKCTTGPLAGQTFVVTDPGRALISGNCADIGKVKGPILRGLAARAPYFHNGSAATLMDVMNFYDQRFNIGFTDGQKQDLVNFLNAL
jgi:cytochrome c peroxidase